MRRGFFRNSPRIVRRLLYLIAFISCLELVLFAVAVTAPAPWAWLVWQICSLSAEPLAIGAVVVLTVGSIMNRRLPPRERHSETEGQQLPYEIAVARTAAKAVSNAVRSREGRATVRVAAWLIIAAKAAMRTSASQREEVSNPDLQR